MPYDPTIVAPMRQELTNIGIIELTTAEAVDEFMKEKNGSALIIINSVCGCAAGSARPGVTIALQNEKIPKRLATVFAGQDMEATAQVRGYFSQMPPSSPSFALFNHGELVFMYPRHFIEGRSPEIIGADLVEAFEEYL